MERFYNNDIIKLQKEIEANKKFICHYNIANEEKEGYDDFVKKILNFETFPYINTEYKNLLIDSFDELDDEDKLQVYGHLNGLLTEYDKSLKKYLKSNNIEKIKDDFLYDEYKGTSKNDIYNNIKGGQYGEMILHQMLIQNGFEKILSKLSLEWGRISPTGIDVTYINLKTKELVLAESKLYKDYKTALKAVIKDIDKIIVGLKFDDELNEWNKRCKQMPDNVREWYVKLSKKEGIITKSKLIRELNKIYVIGFVVADNNKNFEKNFLLEQFEYDNKKYIACLISVPIKAKEEFIESCIKQVNKLEDEIKLKD